jgi:toxin CcdB
MQHEVFANPAPRTRAAFPFIAVLQADVADEGRGRIIAPMAPRSAMPSAPGWIAPLVRHADQNYLLVLELMTSISRTVLRAPLGSVAAHRDEITRALDWLFTGV